MILRLNIRIAVDFCRALKREVIEGEIELGVINLVIVPNVI